MTDYTDNINDLQSLLSQLTVLINSEQAMQAGAQTVGLFMIAIQLQRIADSLVEIAANTPAV